MPIPKYRGPFYNADGILIPNGRAKTLRPQYRADGSVIPDATDKKMALLKSATSQLQDVTAKAKIETEKMEKAAFRARLVKDLTAPKHGDVPPLLGARWRASDAGRTLDRNGGLSDDLTADDLISRDELIGSIRTRAAADLFPLLPGSVQAINEMPFPSTLAGLIEIVPADVPLIDQWTEQAIVAGGQGVPLGVEAPHVGGDWARVQKSVVRWPLISTLPESVLRDSPVLERYLNRLQTKTLWRSLEADILSGDGSTAAGRIQLTGVLHAPGVQTYARAGGDTFADAIGAGIAAVQNAGFYGETSGLSVLASPTTLKRIFLQKDSVGAYLEVDDALPAVSRWVPTASLPDGQALVGDFYEAITLYVHRGLSVTMTQNYFDPTTGSNYFGTDRVAVMLESYVWSWPHNPPALCLATNLVV